MIAIAVLVLAAAAQDAPKPREITLPCNWKVGSQLAITSERREERTIEGRESTQNGGTRTPMLLEVVERHDDGYTMRWTLGAAEIVAASRPPHPTTEIMTSLLDGLVFDVRTDPFGVPQRLIDVEGVDGQVQRLAKARYDALVASGTPAKEAQFVLHGVRDWKGPTFHASLVHGPQLFTMACGAKLEVGKRASWESDLPNPFGGATIPSLGQIWIASVDDAKREVVVEWRNSVDPVRGKTVIEAGIRAMAKANGKDLPPNAVFDLGAIEDASTTTIDLDTGWPKTMVYTRTSVMFEQRTVESLRMDAKLVEAK